MPWAMSCTRTSGRGQGPPRRMAAKSLARRTRRVAGQGVVRPGADLAQGGSRASGGRERGEVANEGECVRLLPGLRPRVPTAVHHRGLDGSTIETTTPP